VAEAALPAERAAALELLVAARLARGEIGGAGEAAGRLAAVASGEGGPRLRAMADLARARVANAAGDAEARTGLQAAAAAFAALDLPLEAARAQLDLGRALAADAPAGAAAEARVALTAFERLGAARDADAAAALLRGLGETGGRSWPRNAATLTKREAEVLTLLEAGRSNQEIAERLVISRRTAEHHVQSILSKLGLRSRAEAAARRHR
jgi:DNA-binding CsgD family transcriptional regulator